MTAKELVAKWKEVSLDTKVLSEKALMASANNFLDLTGAWFKNEKKPENVTPTYMLRFSNNEHENLIAGINEDNAAYEIMTNVLPNDMSYGVCELISVYYENSHKHETVLGSLTIV